jgi:hypothetical protein
MDRGLAESHHVAACAHLCVTTGWFNNERKQGTPGVYEAMPKGLRAMAALVVLRNKAIQPPLAAAQELRPSRGAQNPQ